MENTPCMFSYYSYTELCRKIAYALQNIIVLSGTGTQFLQNRQCKIAGNVFWFVF